MMPSGTSFLLRSVWGSGPNDVFAVGEAGTVLRYDGTRWYAMPNPTTKALRAVWGTGPTDVYASGEDGVLFRFDGSEWSALDSRTTRILLGLWGDPASGKVLSVGTTATIIEGTR